MQKEELIKLDFKQKTSAAAVLFLCFYYVRPFSCLTAGKRPYPKYRKRRISVVYTAAAYAGLYFYLEAFSKASIADLKRACLIAVLF
jgi:predicted secreted protein